MGPMSAQEMRKAASRVGVDPEYYEQRISVGEKWCSGCKTFHSRAAFPKDSSRYDGLSMKCSSFINAAYVPRTRVPAEQRFWSYVSKGDGCWEWTGSLTDRGYGQFRGPCKSRRAHVASFMLHFGEVPSGMIVCHRCDNPRCVRPDHLYAGTHADNAHDRENRGRSNHVSTPMPGDANPAAKLDWETVRAIRRDRKAGRSLRQIAAVFGVCVSQVRNIVAGKCWKEAA